MRVAGFLFFAAVAAASPPSSAANWCSEGTGVAMIGGSPQEVVRQIKQKCKAGDTIGIPSTSSFVIGSICDFTKTIFVGRDGMTMCVIAK